MRTNEAIKMHGASQYHTTPNNMLLTRGFSKVLANEEILNETRNQIELTLKRNKASSATMHMDDLTVFSFMLPDLTQYTDEFREFLHNDLIEVTASVSLTDAGHLNWWSTNVPWDGACRNLYPMCTSGDGNCLLHAVSLAMWGLHDRYLILRKALHTTLEDIKSNSALWRRWKYEQMLQNRKFGLIYSDEEWDREWSALLRLSSYQPRTPPNQSTLNEAKLSPNDTNPDDVKLTCPNKIENDSGQQDGVYFESLEEFHVFVLAQIIQRPIIIVSDTVLHDSNGEPLAPIPFGGIYLPLECDKDKCYSYPILLTYDSAHFSALVLMDDENGLIKQNDVPYPIIPITYSTMDLLTIHFSYDPGKDFSWHKLQDNFPNELSRNDKMYILQDYLRLVKIELHNESTVSMANIRVDKPTSYVTYQVDNKTKQKAKNTKLQKFLNIFKRDSHSPSTKINEKYNMQKTSSKTLTSHASAVRKQQKKSRTCMPLAAIESNTVCNFKNWDLLFDSLSPNTTILAAQLNLNKPPKYERIVENYISSAKDKYLHILQLEKQKAHPNPTIAQSPPQPQQYQVAPNHSSHINGKYHNLANMSITPKCAFYNCNRPVDYRYSKTLCQNCAINVYHDEMR